MALPVPELLAGRVTCADVVRCAYDLRDPEVAVFDALQKGPATSEAIAARLGKDPSVVYRNLQRLVQCGLVTKEARTLDGGGYLFEYASLPKAEVKRRLHACIEEWSATMRRAVAKL